MKWRISEGWRDPLFADANQEYQANADPVAPAKRPDAAREKIASKTLNDGTPVLSFRTLPNELSTIVRNTCRRRNHDATEPTLEIDTTQNDTQRAALDQINAIRLVTTRLTTESPITQGDSYAQLMLAAGETLIHPSARGAKPLAASAAWRDASIHEISISPRSFGLPCCARNDNSIDRYFLLTSV